MAVGGPDLLCVIPRNKIDSVGIPFLHLTLEGTVTELEKNFAGQILDLLPKAVAANHKQLEHQRRRWSFFADVEQD